MNIIYIKKRRPAAPSLFEAFYIAGNFQGTYAGVGASIWDGSKWNSFGDPNGNVYAFIKDSSDNIYAGGAFTSIGGITANRIAKWNGTQWSSSYGTGFNNIVTNIALDSSENLYAVGYFTTANGVTVNRIAKWNGTQWSSLGSGFNSNAYGIEIDSSGNIYAGGFFTTANGVTVNYIAKWNGTQWSSLGTGLNNYVYNIKFDSSGDLYVAGRFTTAGGTTVNGIAKWNVTTETWSGFGAGLGNTFNPCRAIMFLDGELVVGGNFLSRIAKWNGTAWVTNLYGTVNNWVWGLWPETSTTFYATGFFTNLGNSDGDRTAYWNGSSWENLGRGSSFSILFKTFIDSNGNFYNGTTTYNNNGLRFISTRDNVLSKEPQ